MALVNLGLLLDIPPTKFLSLWASSTIKMSTIGKISKSILTFFVIHN